MSNKRIRVSIIGVSLVIPLFVAFLYTNIRIVKVAGIDLSFLPGFNALINSLTFIVLISALIAVKNKRYVLHRTLMSAAMFLSVMFLASYVVFHSLYQETSFGGEGTIKSIYYFVLITHILFSAIVLPLVLFAFYHGLIGNYEVHKKIVKFAYPVWTYVALTGVVVYLMISPYYQFLLK
jgi:putative membrane protein